MSRTERDDGRAIRRVIDLPPIAHSPSSETKSCSGVVVLTYQYLASKESLGMTFDGWRADEPTVFWSPAPLGDGRIGEDAGALRPH
jgi:hypothetical protein